MTKKRSIFIWITACIILVYAMIIVGGYTRLTHSGLSIVEWKPITGTFPPLNDSAWDLEFLKYQQSPEYQKVNRNMNLIEFKQIFLVEYFHRLLGRITGLVFFLPFLYFAFTKKLSFSNTRYFLVITVLMALQGGIGWFMVKSGLVDQPNVSQYRLALHLAMACLILILLTLKLFNIRDISKYQIFTLGLLFLQIISGAFVAGLRAGLTYNTFPLMNGEIVPDGLLFMKPWYLNMFENITTVQFMHRVLGTINVINILIYSYKINNKASILLAGLVVFQFTLGILTLILQVPLALGLLHQAIAILLLIALLITFEFKTNFHILKI